MSLRLADEPAGRSSIGRTDIPGDRGCKLRVRVPPPKGKTTGAKDIRRKGANEAGGSGPARKGRKEHRQ